jgi:hypothetical protein
MRWTVESEKKRQPNNIQQNNKRWIYISIFKRISIYLSNRELHFKKINRVGRLDDTF